MGRTPNFLIVGAMKAGTTTVFRDLCLHPHIFEPSVKEPDIIATERPKSEILADFGALFGRARDGQLCGEASTSYTKLPTFTGVAERALETCGPDLKVVYLTRDPVDRTVSHYLHELQNGKITHDFSTAIRTADRFVDYSRYDWQLQPWISTFGRDNVRRIALSNYSANRQKEAELLVEFLGLKPALMPRIDPISRANVAGEPKGFEEGLIKRFAETAAYQKVVKGLLPAHIREILRRKLLPWKEVPPVTVSDADRNFIMQAISQEPLSGTQEQVL